MDHSQDTVPYIFRNIKGTTFVIPNKISLIEEIGKIKYPFKSEKKHIKI